MYCVQQFYIGDVYPHRNYYQEYGKALVAFHTAWLKHNIRQVSLYNSDFDLMMSLGGK